MDTALFQQLPGNGRQELQERVGVLRSAELRRPLVQRPPTGNVE
jgi:hypothetical protein